MIEIAGLTRTGRHDIVEAMARIGRQSQGTFLTRGVVSFLATFFLVIALPVTSFVLNSGRFLLESRAAPECTRAAPLEVVTPPSQTGAASKSLTYRAAVTNEDNAVCPVTVIRLTAKVPTGWTAKSLADSGALRPNETLFFDFVVTPPATVLSGSYVLEIEASPVIYPTPLNLKTVAKATYVIPEIPLPCLKSVPTFQFLNPYQKGQAGATLSYDVRITNNDNRSCPKLNLSIAPSVSWKGFTADPASKTYDLQPNESQTFTEKITSPIDTKTGSYYFNEITTVKRPNEAPVTLYTAGRYEVVPGPCKHNNPKLEISEPFLDDKGGQPVYFLTTLTNKDSEGCSPSDFSLVTSGLPTSWYVSPIQTTYKQVSPDKSAVYYLKIIPASDVAVGSYGFNMKVTNQSVQGTYEQYAAGAVRITN